MLKISEKYSAKKNKIKLVVKAHSASVLNSRFQDVFGKT